MLRTITIIQALAVLITAETPAIHKVFKIIPESEDQVQALRDLGHSSNGYDFWKSPSLPTEPALLMVAPETIDEFSDRVKSLNITYETHIENVEALLKARRSNRRTKTRRDGRKLFDWKSYKNLEEIYNWLDSLAERFPGKVEVIVGGQTYKGRQIKGVKLSSGESKPGIFIESGIHAREWISHATATYLINELLTSNEPAIRNLAESYDWYIFPVFNPDGYAYTHEDSEDIGQRLWRKTLSPNESPYPFLPINCDGTDLNRNWNFKWREGDAHKNPCAENYAGYRPFSEIESQTLSEYIKSLSGKLFAYIAFHSFSQFLMFPWGYTDKHLDDYDDQMAIGRAAAQALAQRYNTQFKVGSIKDVMGQAITATTLDWVKDTLKLPLVYVYELRDQGQFGFLLPEDQIIPTGQEMVDSLVALFKEAKKFGYPSK